MRKVSYNRKKFLQTLRHIAFLLQIIFCIALFATFYRLLREFKLPTMFILLPFMFILLLSLGRCLMLYDRKFTNILIGAATGFTSGFLSSIVQEKLTQDFPYPPYQLGKVLNEKNNPLNSYNQTLQIGNENKYLLEKVRTYLIDFVLSLEFLHIPVMIGAIAYSFCLIFGKFPPLRIILLSFAMGVCCMSMFTLCSIMMKMYEEKNKLYRNYNFEYLQNGFIGQKNSQATCAFLIFLGTFSISLMPSIRVIKRLWLVSFFGFVTNIMWQSYHLDTMQWNWERSQFPIPGFLTAAIFLFGMDGFDMQEISVLRNVSILKRKKYVNEKMKPNLSKCYQSVHHFKNLKNNNIALINGVNQLLKIENNNDHTMGENKLSELENANYMSIPISQELTQTNEESSDLFEDTLHSIITSHCLAYVIERTTLSVINETQNKYKRIRKNVIDEVENNNMINSATIQSSNLMHNSFKNVHQATDTWFCCMAMLGLFLVYTSDHYFGVNSKVIISLLVGWLYFCLGVSTGMMCNGFFLDGVFGLIFLILGTGSDFVVFRENVKKRLDV